jgi:hypothetical protein
MQSVESEHGSPLAPSLHSWVLTPSPVLVAQIPLAHSKSVVQLLPAAPSPLQRWVPDRASRVQLPPAQSPLSTQESPGLPRPQVPRVPLVVTQ